MTAIVAIGTSVPEFVATNRHVISLVLERSERGYSGDLADLERDVAALLERMGSRERRWRSGLSTPIDHVLEAWENCVSRLDRGSLAKIGTLIYCGIDRGIGRPGARPSVREAARPFRLEVFGYLGCLHGLVYRDPRSFAIRLALATVLRCHLRRISSRNARKGLSLSIHDQQSRGPPLERRDSNARRGGVGRRKQSLGGRRGNVSR